MANQNFQDLAADKFDYDSQAARDLLRTPWLDDHLASRAAAKAARETEKAQRAIDTAQLAAPPEVPEDSSLLPNLDVKDPYHPANFFSQTNVGRSTVDERSTRVKEWMKTHSANYLTPKGIAEFNSEAARKAPDNAFGLAKKETMADNVKDVGLSVGQGIVGSAEAITSIFGADNGASKWLNAVKEKLGDNKSAASKIDSAAMQAKIKEMEASGSTIGEIKAYFNAFLEQPAEMIAQGIGSFATLGVGKAAQALGAGAKLARGINIGTGAVQGIGGAKGQQYESVKALAKEQGKTEAEAEALAVKAQEYSPENFVRLGVAGVLGAIASGTGVESAVFGKAATGGLLARGLKGVTKEAIPEALQEGQSKEAANDAAIRAKLLDESKRFQGVAGSAVQAGVIGGILGGGVDVVSGGQPEYKPPATDNGAPKATNAPATATDTTVAQDTPKPVATPTVLPSYEKSRVENVGAVQKAFKEVANLSGTDEEVATQTSAIVGALAPEQRAEYERVAAAGHTVSDNGVVLTRDGTPIPVFEARADRLPYQLLESEVAVKNAAEKIDAATSPAMRTAAINAAKATLGKDIFKDRFSDVGEVKNIDGLNANLKSLWEALPEVQKAKNEPTQTPTQSTPTTGLPSDNSLDGVGAVSAGGVSGGDSVAGNSDQNIVRPGQQPAGSVAQDQVSYAAQTAAEVVLAGYTKSPNTASLIDLQATAKSLGIIGTDTKTKKQVVKQISAKLAELDTQAEYESSRADEAREQEIIDAGPGGNTFETTSTYATREFTTAFGQDPANLPSAVTAAQALTPVMGALKVAYVALPSGTLARYNRETGGIEVSNTYPFTQDRLIEALVEERLHALDSYSPTKTLSQSAPTFMAGGAVRNIAQAQLDQEGVFGEMLQYPMRNIGYSDSRIAAELFARIGILFIADPQQAAKVFPTLKDVYGLRPLEDYTVDERLRDQIPETPRTSQRTTQNRVEQRVDALTISVFGRVGSQGADSTGRGIAQNRRDISQALNITVPGLHTRVANLASTASDQAKTSVLNDTFATQGAQATLDTMAEKASWFERGVISAIRPFLRNVTLAANVPPNTKEGTLGLYMPMSRQIWLAPNASQHTVLHEMVHAAVDTIMHTKLSSLNARQQRAVSTLHKLYGFAAANPRFAGRYANTNVHEFIAEAMSNQQFQVELNAMSVEELFKGAPTSMWDKFKDTIASVLGINNTTLKSSLLTTRALLNDLISAPIERQSESLALIGTTRQQKAKTTAGIWRRVSESVGTNFADFGLRGLNQMQDARDAALAAGNNQLAAAVEDVRQKFILRDDSAAAARLTKEIAEPVENLIKTLAAQSSIAPDELRRVASEVAIAQHSLDMSKKRQAEIDQDLEAAKVTVDSYESIENLGPEFKAKAAKAVAVIDKLNSKAASIGATVDTQEINEAVLGLEAVIDEFAASVRDAGGKEVISARAKQMIAQSVRRAKSSKDLHTWPTDSRRLINAVFLVSHEFGLILDSKAEAQRSLATAEQESANWYAAQTNDPVLQPDNRLQFFGATKLPGGMQMKGASKIIDANDIDPDRDVVLAVVEAYRDAFKKMGVKAVEHGIVTPNEDAAAQEEYPLYVSTMGTGEQDPGANLTERNHRGFLGTASGSSHYLSANDVFTNIHLRLKKLAQVEGSVELGKAIGAAVDAGSKDYVRHIPDKSGTPYVRTQTVDANGRAEPVFYAPVTKELQEAFGSPPVADGKVKKIGVATRTMGKLYTQFTPLFAPLGYVRDTMTRTFNLRGRESELVRADGSMVSVAEARARMAGYALDPRNLAEAGRYAWNGVESPLMAEFVAAGGLTTFSDTIKSEADVERIFTRGTLGKAWDGANKFVHKYNAHFETAATLASFKALRDSGLSSQQAAFLTLDAMNFRRAGKLSAQYMQPGYLFFNANAQDTRQFMRVIVDRNGKINKRGVAEIAFLAAAAYAIFGATRDMSDDDEEGGKVFDSLTLREKLTSINIGGYKIPLGFGWLQTGFALGALQQMVTLEQLTPHEAMLESTSAIVKNFVPLGISEVAFTKAPGLFIVQTLAPDLLSPALSVATGKNFMGANIVSNLQTNKFRSEQGTARTPEAYKSAARAIRENSFIGVDIVPEEVKALADGYFAGPMALLLEQFVDAEGDKAIKGRDNLATASAVEKALGISRITYKSNDAKQVVSAFYRERDKLIVREQELNATLPHSKLAGDEKFPQKLQRYKEAGATDEELRGFDALHKFTTTKAKLATDFRGMYERYVLDGSAEDEMQQNAADEIAAQKLFVQTARGILQP